MSLGVLSTILMEVYLSALAQAFKINNVILPSSEQRNLTQLDEPPPTIKVTSQPNSTTQSYRHPFACWTQPDFFSSQNTTYATDSTQDFDISCWTNALPFHLATQASTCTDDRVAFFQTKEGCWIPDFNIQVSGEQDLRERVRFCPTPIHMVGSFRPQYEGKSYCYTCTKLDCSDKPRAHNEVGVVELGCWKSGNKIDGDDVWWRVVNEDCWIPNQVFDPYSLQGNGLHCARD